MGVTCKSQKIKLTFSRFRVILDKPSRTTHEHKESKMARPTEYVITLTEAQRDGLHLICSLMPNTDAAKRAELILCLEEGWTRPQLVAAGYGSAGSISYWKQKWYDADYDTRRPNILQRLGIDWELDALKDIY